MRAARAGVVLCGMLLWSCTSTDSAIAPGSLVVAIRVAPNNLDPRFGNDEASQRVAQLVFGSLMDIGDDLRVHPTLAERLDNPDPLTYRAVLRRGVKFHDGHEFSADDVVFTYRQYLDPAFVSPWKGAFRVLESVTALSRYEVEFKLNAPFAAFPIQLVSPPIVPAGAGPELARHPIGTGPYRFVRYDVDDKVVLAPFSECFTGAPKNAGLVLRVIPDDTMRGLELRKGTIDAVVNDLPPDIVHQLEEEGRLRLTKAAGLDYMYLSLNTVDPVLRDPRVRQAVAYAINTDAIVEYLRRGLARPARGLIPSQAWAFDPTVRQYRYDPQRARALLDQAGYGDPDGAGPAPRLRLVMKLGTVDEYRLQAAVIQEQLRDVGIELEVRSIEFATLFADVVKGNFQMVQMQWSSGALVDPDILRRVFHSNQVPPAGFNRGHYSNPEVDRLIDMASEATDEMQRKGYYGAAQRLIADDAPYVSLWNRTNVIVAQPDVVGLRINSVGNFEALKDATRTGATPGPH
ncbi:MAG: ABC transporter substrate-binding protein [Vicinamibacterales bacterium]